MTNVYLPDGSKKLVIREEDQAAWFRRGFIDEAAYIALERERALARHNEWLASPDTVAERFQMLRASRDERLARTDYLMASDYPITESQRQNVAAYRQALRDLPGLPGSPWDGGGPLTPWPEPD